MKRKTGVSHDEAIVRRLRTSTSKLPGKMKMSLEFCS
jgi:hypothetical protein